MQKGDKAMATTAIRLNKELVDKAQAYATAEGKSLSSIIEDFLSRLTSSREETEEIPDIVLSLLGAGVLVDDDNITTDGKPIMVI